MKWSFGIAVATHAEVAAALRAEGERVVEGFNAGEVERAKNYGEKEMPEPIAHEDYITALDAICDAAAGVVAQLPETPGFVFSVNVLGHVERNSAGDVVDGNSTVRVDMRRA